MTFGAPPASHGIHELDKSGADPREKATLETLDPTDGGPTSRSTKCNEPQIGFFNETYPVADPDTILAESCKRSNAETTEEVEKDDGVEPSIPVTTSSSIIESANGRTSIGRSCVTRDPENRKQAHIPHAAGEPTHGRNGEIGPVSDVLPARVPLTPHTFGRFYGPGKFPFKMHVGF